MWFSSYINSKCRPVFFFYCAILALFFSGLHSAIASDDKVKYLHQLGVTKVQPGQLGRQQNSVISSSSSLSGSGNGNNINNSNIIVRTTNTVTGDIISKSGSSVSIGSTTIGSISEDEKNSVNPIFTPTPIPNQVPLVPLPDEDIIRQCMDGVPVPSDIDKCWDDCKCFEVDGCSAPVPWKNGIAGYPDIFGEEEVCCAEPTNKPCNQHDRCYQSCDTTQLECDLLLYELMSGACKDLPITAEIRCQAKAATYFNTLAPQPLGAGTGIVAFLKRKMEMCIF